MRTYIPLIISFFFVRSDSFTPICNKVCICNEDLTAADCSRITTNIIPPVDMWPENVTELDLSHNFITAVDVEMTHDQLSSLKLSNNKIKSINQSIFGGLRNLQYLDLSYNEIEELEVETFYGLENLLVLNIKNNNVKKLMPNVFFNLLGIEGLLLSSNPFSHFEKIHFHSNINLKRLEVAEIGAYALPIDVFSGTVHLEYLDLSSNKFHEVPTNALRSARNLKWLQFSSNPIEELNQKSFRQLTTLEVLQLNFMPELKTVGAQTFSDLQNLKQLEMKVNKKLTFVDGEAFSGLFNDSTPILKVLDFEMNQLSTFMKIPCKDLDKLNFQKNPWTCDCYLKWLRQCYIPEIYVADLKCSAPRRFKGQLLVNVPERDFVCEVHSADVQELMHHNRVLRALSLAFTCIVIVMLGALVIFVLKFRSIKTWYKNKKRGPGAVYYVRAKTLPIEP